MKKLFMSTSLLITAGAMTLLTACSCQNMSSQQEQKNVPSACEKPKAKCEEPKACQQCTPTKPVEQPKAPEKKPCQEEKKPCQEEKKPCQEEKKCQSSTSEANAPAVATSAPTPELVPELKSAPKSDGEKNSVSENNSVSLKAIALPKTP